MARKRIEIEKGGLLEDSAVKAQTTELYKKYRPADWCDVVGQPEAVDMLTGMIDRYEETRGKEGVPHAMLFIGDSGCGKTTSARIMARYLRCHEADYDERNSADARGIDEMRSILGRVNMLPMMGHCRVFVIDECHQMTADAQNAILKVLEDTPKHVYFILCTTNPTKVIKTIQTRCTIVKFRKLTAEEIERVVLKVADDADMPLDNRVLQRIVGIADGSPRRALVALDAVHYMTDSDKQLEALAKGQYEAEGINVARAVYSPKTNWREMAEILKANKTEPETVRLIVLGYMNTILCSGKTDDRAFRIIDAFSKPFFDNGANAYLTAACYEIICGK